MSLRRIALLSIFFLIAPAIMAQTFRGAIQGSVTDSTGAAIAGADVKVSHVETGLTRTVQTNEQGDYSASELPLGAYEVTVSKQGFRTQTMKGATVSVGAAVRVDAKLTPGEVKESLIVTADIALVDTSGNTLGGTISGEQAADLPINGRDFTKLLVLVPGATGDPVGSVDSPGSFGLFSVNGNRGRSNNYLLDGTDMNDGYRNLPAINEAGVYGTPATVLPVDALAEVPVMSNVDAEFGRNSGGIVNLVTRSGGNQFHGSLFENFRNAGMGARNYFNTKDAPKNPFQNNQFGGSASGPIAKDQTFWFVAYEGQRENGGLPVKGVVPTTADIAAATPAGGVNPVIAKVLALHPWGTLPTSGTGETTFSNPFSNRADSLIAKIDHHLGKDNRDLLTVRYLFGDSWQSFPLALLQAAGPSAPGYNTVTPTRANIISASYTKVVTTNLLMEFRGGYNRYHQDFFAQDRSLDPTTLGLNTLAPDAASRDWGLPIISIAGLSQIGANAGNPRGRVDTNYQLFWNTNYTKGNHNFKWGYEWRRTFVNAFFDARFRGKLTFDSLDAFLAGLPSGGASATGSSKRYTYQNNSGTYIQDNWKVNNKLTFNYGLRWDYFGVIGEKNNQFSLVDPTSGDFVQVGGSGKSTLYPKNFKHFGPRVSLAYDLFGDAKTVLRAGWGLYYDSFSQDFFTGQLPWNTLSPGVAYNNRLFSSSLASDAQGNILPLSSSRQVFTDYGATDAWTVAQNLTTPQVQNFNLNIEQQITSGLALQIGYVGSQGRHLFRYTDQNQIDAHGNVRYPQYVYVNQFESSASSGYNSLQASLKMNNWHGLTSTVNYTWGHSIDNASDGQDYVPNAAQPDNSFNPGGERASSNFDTRHRFQWFWNYDVPAFGRSKWFGSGWGLNGVAVYSTGQPFTVNYLYENDYNGSGEWFGRLDLVGDPKAGTSGPGQFLNLAAFAAPCTWDSSTGDCAPGSRHFGTNGRNAFRGPNYANFDFAVSKTTKLSEKLSMQLRVDFFNLFNHANFSNPLLPAFSVDAFVNGTTFVPSGSGTTGRLVGTGYLPITATPDVGTGNPYLGGGGPRNIQLGAKFTF
jgi:hypothetical protein